MKKIKADYATCARFLKNLTGESLDYEEYEWAWLCGRYINDSVGYVTHTLLVNTRCIHMTTMNAAPRGGNIALAPLLDFLNHTCDAKVLCA